MKKLLTFLLSIVMILSMFNGVAYAAENEYSLPDGSKAEIGVRAKGYMEWQGIPRMYEYYIPSSFNGRRMQAMITIVGSGHSSEMQLDEISGFIPVAEEMGFIVIAVNAVTWLPEDYAEYVDRYGKEVYADTFMEWIPGRPQTYTYEVDGVRGCYVNGSAGYTTNSTHPLTKPSTGEASISGWIQSVTTGSERVVAVGIDDEGFYCALAQELAACGLVDKNRVFASGLSNGGYMSLRLAALHGDIFAGVCSVAGLVSLSSPYLNQVDENTPNDPIKLIFIHGDQDSTVRPGALISGTGYPNAKYDDSGLVGRDISWFTQRYGLGNAVETSKVTLPKLDVEVPMFGGGSRPDESIIERRVFNDGAAILYWVVGGGHTWPGGTQYADYPVVGYLSHQMNASKVMMEDFWIELNESVEASVVELEGNKNELTITITKEYDNGKTEVVTEKFTIKNNAAGVYQVDDYQVYVDTEDDQVLECYIVEDEIDDGRVRVSLSGSSIAETEGDAEYVLSVGNMDKLATVTAWFEVDGDYFSGKEVKGLNGFEDLDGIKWESKGGSLWSGRVTLTNMDGGVTSDGYLDIIKLTLAVKDKLGDTGVKLTRIDLSGYDENNSAVYFESNVKNGKVITEIVQWFSAYDVNRDGKIDQLDLTTAQKYFAAKEGDADWNEAKLADVSGNGSVGIEDLILILNNIVW